MKAFTNLNELIKRLYAERKLLHALFQARLRFDFSYEEAVGLVDDERNLRLLIDYGVVRQEGDLIELEETYQHFFEDVMRLNEDITSSTVEENLQALKDSIDFYLKERNHPEAQGKYVRKIMRSMRNISTQASTKTIELKRVINDTFRQERNYEIKRSKLESNLATLESISSLIRKTERLLDEKRETLEVLTADDRITRLILDVKIQFKDVFHSLIELERVIRDYLNQIDAHNRLVKHIRKLKYLKDQPTWERATNVRDVIDRCNHQALETQSYYSTKISLSFLRNSDDAIEIIDQARKSISRLRSLKNTPAIPLTENDLNAECVVEDFVDTDSIANAFFASSQDLYSFVLNYPYAQPQNRERKVEYYLEIVQNHYNKLLFSGEEHEDITRESIKYLKSLTEALTHAPEISKLPLEQTFSLKFKIEENDNSTGWTENIKAVGSEGTDTLVKAIMNILLISVFKKRAGQAGNFRLHCMMDEIGRLADENIQGILNFANERDIYIVNSSPKSHRPLSYRRLYLLSKDKEANTIVQPILSTREAELQ